MIMNRSKSAIKLDQNCRVCQRIVGSRTIGNFTYSRGNSTFCNLLVVIVGIIYYIVSLFACNRKS